MYDDILVPTDGSDASARAVDTAIDLAERYGARLHTLYVVETRSVHADAAPDVFVAMEDVGEEAVDDVAARAEAAGIGPVESTVERGVPHQAVLDYVDENGIDVVVMGTHGRTGLGRYLLGSVTEKVVRHARVPVLTVPLPDAEA